MQQQLLHEGPQPKGSPVVVAAAAVAAAAAAAAAPAAADPALAGGFSLLQQLQQEPAP